MKIGIFGGTFDPVHEGHIKMAEYARDILGMDKIIFVPNANPPHKKDKRITDYSHRFKMLELAVSGKKDFRLSDYEAKGGRYYYSLDTLRHFRGIYGEDMYFIIGGDSLTTIHLWYEYKTVLKENKLIVFLRENQEKLLKKAEEYRSRGADITIAAMKEVEISSTEIRKRIKNSQNINNLVDKRVYDYIKANGLYGVK